MQQKTTEKITRDRENYALGGKIYREKQPLTNLTCWAAPGRVSFKEATDSKNQFEPIEIGHEFSPPWSTHWIKLQISIPNHWKNEEIHLLWDSSSEETVYDESGKVLQGMNGSTGEDRRFEFVLSYNWKEESNLITLWLEIACNGLFGCSDWEMGPKPPNPDKKCPLTIAEIALFDKDAYGLYCDHLAVADIAQHCENDSAASTRALFVANQMINIVDLSDRSTWPAARALASTFLNENQSATSHTLWAVGHCHIDTAWLWPYAETRRKVVRSWSTQLRLMEEFPQYKFACSQAQQYQWLSEDNPQLFERVKAAAKGGQFVPIGGTWVEMDCNLPSGESLVRQFLYGQRYFEKEFGQRSNIFWLPDTFGYSSQLPQIMQKSGIEYFLTQKLSWNQVNKMPNTTFSWRGIDGSRVIVHFPPADTYNSHATPSDFVKSEKNNKDKDRSNHSLMLFGHGDGGGGPNRKMLDSLTRCQAAPGLPKIKFASPTEFFDQIKRDSEHRALCEWRGELYFEYHRGTYTSQANNKRDNRRCEELLRDVELMSSAACWLAGAPVPRAELERLWRLVLLNQFHDVIPGTSINEVFGDTKKIYSDVLQSGKQLLNTALESFGFNAKLAAKDNLCVVNTLAHDRVALVQLPFDAALLENKNFQKIENDQMLGIVHVSSMSSVCGPPATICQAMESAQCAFVAETADVVTMTAAPFCAKICRKTGRLLSFLLDSRESIDETLQGGNQFVIHDDVPLFWDAWDVDIYHLEKKKPLSVESNVADFRVVENGPVRVAVQFSMQISGKSKLTQTISLSALGAEPGIVFDCQVDWHEKRKFLKVEFPLNVSDERANFEIPFGVTSRPTHFNTSWDAAKFEVCAHRFADLSEHGFGVSLLNESKYGYSCHDNVLTLSLLRSPKHPDPECDMGQHRFKFALLPHVGTLGGANVAQSAENFNNPLIVGKAIDQSDFLSQSLFSLDRPGLVLQSVKLAEDSNDLIVRLYEAYGGRGVWQLHWNEAFKISNVVETNLLEDDVQPVKLESANSIKIQSQPFEIHTFKLKK